MFESIQAKFPLQTSIVVAVHVHHGVTLNCVTASIRHTTGVAMKEVT